MGQKKKAKIQNVPAVSIHVFFYETREAEQIRTEATKKCRQEDGLVVSRGLFGRCSGEH